METRGRKRRGTPERSLAVLLTLALIGPALSAGERKGAELVLVLRNGSVVQGELLSVKGNEILLLRGSTSAEETEQLADIESIKVLRKSKWLTGMVIGAVAGALLGAAVSPKNVDPNADDVALDKGSGAFVGAIGFGALGAYIGSTVKDKTIRVERTDPKYLAGIAAKLKKWARSPA